MGILLNNIFFVISTDGAEVVSTAKLVVGVLFSEIIFLSV
jgi:hypothetical protein